MTIISWLRGLDPVDMQLQHKLRGHKEPTNIGGWKHMLGAILEGQRSSCGHALKANVRGEELLEPVKTS